MGNTRGLGVAGMANRPSTMLPAFAWQVTLGKELLRVPIRGDAESLL